MRSLLQSDTAFHTKHGLDLSRLIGSTREIVDVGLLLPPGSQRGMMSTIARS